MTIAAPLDDREAALAIRPVSRETEGRLALFIDELRRWQPIQNLVGPASLPSVWVRHVADSLQLLDFAPPDLLTWVDLGSGGGFPGLVMAIAAMAERPEAHVHLVESNARKCSFLRQVVRLTGASATVHEGRIDDVVGRNPAIRQADVVSARALAPLRTLLDWAAPLLTRRAVGLFPKGRAAQAELTEAAEYWTVTVEMLPSRTDPGGRIVRITALTERPRR